MSRAISGVVSRRRRKKILKRAKGFTGAHSKTFRKAHEAVNRAMSFAYAGRRVRKRDFRRLWIARINAAVRMEGLNYSQFMNAMKLANIDLNRKMLSELAIHDPAAFRDLVETARKHLSRVA